ncbi:MAG TPA: M48 family metalloprotease [Solirubrobacteraceae bacterium]|nr:M48 family metalloprotease [Solirubrobacteraceae bacterium]
MVLAAVITPILVVALVVAVFLLLPPGYTVGVGVAIALGIAVSLHERRRNEGGQVLQPQEAPELFAAVDRVCVIADLARPEIVIEHERQPNSWIVAPPGRPPRLHVTAALLELLEPDELTAVIAHELSHLANRDALVMTVVGTPGVILLRGGFGSNGTRWLFNVGVMLAGMIGLLSRVGTNALSRCRELTADASAATLTGHPSTLAAALMKVSGAIEQVPRADLRAVAARDSFHLVAAERFTATWFGDSPLVRRLFATHPPIERRLRALEELEHRLHHPAH